MLMVPEHEKILVFITRPKKDAGDPTQITEVEGDIAVARRNSVRIGAGPAFFQSQLFQALARALESSRAANVAQ